MNFVEKYIEEKRRRQEKYMECFERGQQEFVVKRIGELINVLIRKGVLVIVSDKEGLDQLTYVLDVTDKNFSQKLMDNINKKKKFVVLCSDKNDIKKLMSHNIGKSCLKGWV